MRLANRTTHDSVWLARIFNAVCPPKLDDETMVIFEPSRRPIGHGHAWSRDAKFRGSIPHAYVGIPTSPKLPQYPAPQARRGATRKGFTVELRTIEELLVYTTAHELAHLRYGPSERPAHAWGMRMVRRYRRRGLPAAIR